MTSAEEITGSTPTQPGVKPYAAPRLTTLGGLADLTATGSQMGAETVGMGVDLKLMV